MQPFAWHVVVTLTVVYKTVSSFYSPNSIAYLKFKITQPL